MQAVEADVHLFRGRLEVRHLKTLGPVPILWDRWKLGNPFARRLLVPELLAAVADETELVLDLKGRERRLGAALLERLEPALDAGRRFTICARSWPLLEPFAGLAGTRLVHSVGSGRDLRRLRRLVVGKRLQAITIHERLLDSRSVQELRELADTILTWPINTLERAQELVHLGVDGLISDRPSALRAALEGEPR